MTELMIKVPDETFVKLEKIAQNFRVTPEELVCVSIADLINEPEDEFQQMVNYVLTKNAELYSRLA